METLENPVTAKTLIQESRVFGSSGFATVQSGSEDQENAVRACLNDNDGVDLEGVLVLDRGSNGGTNGVFVKCSSLVEHETQIKEPPFVNVSNAVLGDASVLEENGEDGVLKMLDEERLDELGACQFNGGDSARKMEALGDGNLLVVEVHGSSSGIAQESASEVGEVKSEKNATFGSEVNNGGQKNMFKEQGVVLPEIEEKIATSGSGMKEMKNENQKGVFEEHFTVLPKNEECPVAEVKEMFETTHSMVEDEEEEEEEEDIDDQDHTFTVGDFVWVKTQNRPWWPGQIYDPSDASKDVAMYYRRDRLLVAFFGEETSAWCYPSQLKPFQEKFQRMSIRENSRRFCNAVEEALKGIGRCVELEMMCSCIPAETLTRLARPLASNSGIRGGVVVPEGRIVGLLVTQFQPAKFLARLRYIAEVVSEISLLERTVLQCQLLAYDHANGYRQLHIAQEITDCIDNVGDAATNKSDFVGPTEETSVRSPRKDWSSSTISNGIGKTSSAETLYKRKKRKRMNDLSSSESRKRKKNKDVKFGIDSNLDEDGSGSNKLASCSKELKQTQRSVSLSAVEENKDFNVRHDDIAVEEGSKTGSLSRERRKSKYLSPPYTILGQEYKSLIALKDSETKSPKVPEVSRAKKNIRRSGFVKMKIKRWKDTARIKQKMIAVQEGNVDVDEMLSEFYSAALDSMYLNESQMYELINVFFLKFRSYRNGSDKEMFDVNLVGRVDKKRESLDIELDSPVGEGGAEKQGRENKEHGNQNSVGHIDTNRNFPDIEVGSLRHESGAKRKKRERKGDAVSQSHPRNSLEIIHELPGKDVHETDNPTFEGDAERKGRERKEHEDLNLLGQADEKRKLLDIELGSPGGEGDAQRKKRKRNSDAVSRSHRKKSLDIPLGSPGKAVHESLHPTSEGGAERKGREKKEGAMSHSRRKMEHTNGEKSHNKDASGEGKMEHTNGEKSHKKGEKSHKKDASGEDFAAALLLKFAPGVPLPTKDDLITLFESFGALNDSETEVMGDSSCARVVFTSSSNAEKALYSSREHSPFGSAAVSYGLQYYTANSKGSKREMNSRRRLAPPSIGGNALKQLSVPLPVAEAPPLVHVRQTLEQMTSALEKAGNEVSPEIKANLENEIKKLLQKVTTMV